MATIPDRIEDAIDALVAKIVAEEPLADVQWINEDAEPIDTADADEVSDSAHSLYQIAVLSVQELTGGTPSGNRREFRRPKRQWRAALIIRAHVYERTRADQGRALIRHVRKIQNWIEDLDDEGKHRSSRGWWIEHRSWGSILDESGRAPSPGARIICELDCFQ
jgi:hypothetical protein